MTLGGEFTGGESSWWRGDRKPNEPIVKHLMFSSIDIILSNFSFSKPNRYFSFTTPKVNKAVMKATDKRMIQMLDRG